MSTVYDAYDPELDRHVALKLVKGVDHSEGESPGRLVREARAMAKISHPNVAPVYDVGIVGEMVFISMELIEGPTLEVWARETARPWTEILRMYMLSGRGLAAAHEVGLVHRDFKPDNVMVGLDDRPRVLDFGLARPAPASRDDQLLEDELPGEDDPSLESSITEADLHALRALDEQGTASSGTFDLQPEVTHTGLVTGTPAYMAPEQHQGEPGGVASDQFAFCVSLWEALYRQRPFGGDNFFEIADAIVEGRLRAPPSGHVPRWIGGLLERGLAVDPRARHPSMRSLLASITFTFKVMHGLV